MVWVSADTVAVNTDQRTPPAVSSADGDATTHLQLFFGSKLIFHVPPASFLAASYFFFACIYVVPGEKKKVARALVAPAAVSEEERDEENSSCARSPLPLLPL